MSESWDEVYEEKERQEEDKILFDFDRIYAPGEKPEFDMAILDTPVKKYDGTDPKPEDPSGGVVVNKLGPDPKLNPGFGAELPVQIKELDLVGA